MKMVHITPESTLVQDQEAVLITEHATRATDALAYSVSKQHYPALGTDSVTPKDAVPMGHGGGLERHADGSRIDETIRGFNHNIPVG